MVQAAEVLGEASEKKKYSDILEGAKESYNKRLWNGNFKILHSIVYGVKSPIVKLQTGENY